MVSNKPRAWTLYVLSRSNPRRQYCLPVLAHMEPSHSFYQYGLQGYHICHYSKRLRFEQTRFKSPVLNNSLCKEEYNHTKRSCSLHSSNGGQDRLGRPNTSNTLLYRTQLMQVKAPAILRETSEETSY